MGRATCVGMLIAIACSVSAPAAGKQPVERTMTSIGITADADDASATMLAEALRDQLRKSARYRLAERPSSAHVVIHVVGLAIPNCRPTSAIAVSYVSLPTEKHLGTAVLTTDRSRATSSARDVLAKVPQMLSFVDRP
jgi:ethanolamine utilization microcompartment shell protein EutL